MDLTTIFPKFGVYATRSLEMFKVRKIPKTLLSLTGNISGTTKTRSLKSCVILCLELTTTLHKFGVCATHSLEMLKVRKIPKTLL